MVSMGSEQRELEAMVTNMTKTIEETIKKAEERGRIKERNSIAVALLDILDEEVIAEKLGLSIEKVRALKK